MKELKKCRIFEEVIKSFFEWCGEEYIFCTWGNLDLLELQRNLDYYGIESISDGPLKFYDLQKLFSIAYEDKKLRRNLEYAIDYLNIEKTVAFHRADSDAYYTAKIMERIADPRIYQNVSFDTYHIPKNKKSEIHIDFEDYSKYISRGFEDRLSALEDREVSSMKCVYCHNSLKRKIKWFTTSNGKNYLSLGYCEEHGNFKGKIRVKKDYFDNVYIVKTIKAISEIETEELYNKKKTSKKNKS